MLPWPGARQGGRVAFGGPQLWPHRGTPPKFRVGGAARCTEGRNTPGVAGHESRCRPGAPAAQAAAPSALNPGTERAKHSWVDFRQHHRASRFRQIWCLLPTPGSAHGSPRLRRFRQRQRQRQRCSSGLQWRFARAAAAATPVQRRDHCPVSPHAARERGGAEARAGGQLVPRLQRPPPQGAATRQRGGAAGGCTAAPRRGWGRRGAKPERPADRGS